NQLGAADVFDALGDENDGVRTHALRLADRWLDQEPRLLDRIAGLIDDPHPGVRLQVALTLGESRQPRAVDTLARLAAKSGDERWMSAAIVSSIVRNSDAFLAKLLAADRPTAGALTLLPSVAETIGAQHEEAPLGQLLERTAKLAGPDSTRQK